MKIIKNITAKFQQNPLPFLFFLSFLLWCFCFRGFLSGQLTLFSDATSYYNHTKFFIDNISRGVYPLWDHAWNCGAPNDFFLRRIGPFNPFLLLIILFQKTGLPYTNAYLLYLAVYYFTGMMGFYLLAKRVLRDQGMAFFACLLLMFSSLGMRVFDSYLMLIVTPMAWFFYFLTAFSEKPEKRHLIGMTLTLMVLATTYIPFYFFTVLLSFVICFILFYPRDTKTILSKYWKFLISNKLVVVICLIVLVLALIPGVMFFQKAGSGEIAIPGRHSLKSSANVLGVAHAVTTSWGVIEDIYYSGYFLTNLKKIIYAVFYIPIIGYILFLTGFLTRMNKKILFFFVWGAGLFLLSAPKGIPVYDFLRRHIFYFKYFKNLHFFLWIILLPVFILFVVQQFQQLLACKSGKNKYLVLSGIFIVHCCFALFIFMQGQSILSSYFSIGLSFLFFCLYFLGFLKQGKPLFLGFLLLLTVVQPLEVYHYFGKNSLPFLLPEYRYRYNYPHMEY